MKFFKNRIVAILLTLVVIVGCLGYGQYKKPAAVEAPAFGDWTYDGAGLISDETEKLVDGYNARWDAEYSGVVALATVSGTRGWEIYDYAVTLGNNWGLGSNDMLLLLDEGGEQYWLVTSENVEKSVGYDRMYNLFNESFEPAYNNGSYDAAVQNVYNKLDDCFGTYLSPAESYDEYSGYYYDPYYDATEYSQSSSDSLYNIIVMLVIIFVVMSWIDKTRYRSWYRRYGYMSRPPVSFVPFIFWHSPAEPGTGT